jgi:hypothetical protein
MKDPALGHYWPASISLAGKAWSEQVTTVSSPTIRALKQQNLK